MQPVTPPRSRSARSPTRRSYKGLSTPKTPFGKKSSSSLNNNLSNALFSPPPIKNPITPGETPRHSSRKKLGDAIAIFPSSSNQRSLFPPTPSTIGSGRSKNFLQPSSASSNHHYQQHQSSPIKGRSSFSSNEEEEITYSSPVAGPTKRKLSFLNVSDLEDNDDEETIIGTPRSKIIDDDLISKWNQEQFQDDDEAEIFIKREKLTNPFMTSGPSSPISSNIIKRNQTNQTEITLINKKGEKLTRTLTIEEQSFKPKNLLNSLKTSSDTNSSSSKIQVFKDE